MSKHCECVDKGCRVHEGQECESKAQTTLRRVDFAGQPRVRFCNDCADDACESGVFA